MEPLTSVTLGAATATATVLPMVNLPGWRYWLLKYRVVWDVAVTGAYIVVFKGTITGLITAVFAGLFFTLAVHSLSSLVEHEKPKFSLKPGSLMPTFGWVRG